MYYHGCQIRESDLLEIPLLCVKFILRCLCHACNRTSQHSQAHARALALDRFRQKAAAAQPGRRKRMAAETLQVIEGPSVSLEAQVIQINDVAHPVDEPFCGVDVLHASVDATLPGLLQKQLDECGLSLTTHPDHGHGLATRRAFKEAEEICTCPAALFTSLNTTMQFLNAPGHGLLAESVVSVTNVLVDGETKTILAVLLGAARFVQDYVGKRRFPNAIFQATPSAGACSGFLKLVVHTPNGSGIAANQPILVGFGNGFDFNKRSLADDTEPRNKKFKAELGTFLCIPCISK